MRTLSSEGSDFVKTRSSKDYGSVRTFLSDEIGFVKTRCSEDSVFEDVFFKTISVRGPVLGGRRFCKDPFL